MPGSACRSRSIPGAGVILADEPTGNLDVANGQMVVQILSDLAHKDNYTVILVTHDISIVKSADVVFQMSDGQLSPYEE